MSRMSDKPALHEINLADGYKVRVEEGGLGLTVVDGNGDSVVWLNCIGTTLLKHYLNSSFDKDGRMLHHQSVKEAIHKDKEKRTNG